MFLTRGLRRLAPLLIGLVLLVSACSSAPDKYEQVQKDTTGFGKPAAVAKQSEKGGTFNQFFPKNEGGYSVVPAQEKKGFAQYKLNQDGKTLAMLTINDTVGLPAAADKYSDATDKIAGYPSVKQGTTATGLLVSDRYQVKVLSRDPSFTEADRATWLQKFDLAGLAQLKSVLSPQAQKKLKAAVKTAPKLPQTAPRPNLVPQPAV
ncbi:MAG: hypothetical protein WA902_22625 [Thermosynechococcaceae cyanobacterium]